MAAAAEDLSGDGGVLKQTLQAGAGDFPKAGQTIFAHYTGKLTDGEIFDSSVGKPHRVDGFHFDLDTGAVIRGWDVGFASMRVGEKAILTLRHDYAYGDKGDFGGKTLIFECELLAFKSLTPEQKAAQDRRVAQLRR